jgi:hypothetical protein
VLISLPRDAVGAGVAVCPCSARRDGTTSRLASTNKTREPMAGASSRDVSGAFRAGHSRHPSCHYLIHRLRCGILSSVSGEVKSTTRRGKCAPRTDRFLPRKCATSWVCAVSTLSEVIDFLQGRSKLQNALKEEVRFENAILNYIDFGKIRGQQKAKDAAVIAAAGGHNLLML